jgi:glycerophosphoryl diester phosphodiesterase
VKMKTYRIVAHRGASAYEPENTIRAIRRAIELKADMSEVDVHSTRDGHLVVIHDAEVDRTTNGKGIVKEMSLQEIRKLDAGKGEKVPTLQELLRVAKNFMGVMIEVKAIGIEKPLLELVRSEGMSNQVIVTSFMSDVVRKIRELESKMSTGQIFSWKIPNIAKKAMELKISAMVPAFELVTEEMVRELHEISVPVYAWTVDDRRVAESLVEIGVDGIITNKPDLMSSKAKLK